MELGHYLVGKEGFEGELNRLTVEVIVPNHDVLWSWSTGFYLEDQKEIMLQS